MTIATVCGNGCGTSLLLKITLEKVLKSEGLSATVEHTDISSAGAIHCDFLMAPSDIEPLLIGIGRPYAVVDNIMSEAEVKDALLTMI